MDANRRKEKQIKSRLQFNDIIFKVHKIKADSSQLSSHANDNKGVEITLIII
jgi:hypothetical protein